MGQQIVIPEKLVESVLKILHTGHQGINKMKNLARTNVYWPKMNEHIETLVGSCKPCQETRPEKKRIQSHQWDPASHAFNRIHVDFFGPVKGKVYFIIVDAYSRWIDVQEVPTTSSAAIIPRLRRLFAYFGVCDVLVSDNGTAFSSQEFAKFCKSNLIHHIRIAPYKAASNGLAERQVAVAKAFPKKLPTSVDINKQLQNFLITQRVTPLPVLGLRAPCELMNGRTLTTCLSKINPSKSTTFRMDLEKSEQYFSRHQEIWTRNYTNEPRWIPAKILYKI